MDSTLVPGIVDIEIMVSNGIDTYEQYIPVSNVTMGSNSVRITNQSLLDAFQNQSNDTEYDCSINTTYDYYDHVLPYFVLPYLEKITTPSEGKLSPNKITSTFSLGEIIENNTEPTFHFPVTTNSTGVLSYSSSDPSVATCDSSGQVTCVGFGTTIITVSIEASADGNYTSGKSTYLLNMGQVGARRIIRPFREDGQTLLY